MTMMPSECVCRCLCSSEMLLHAFYSNVLSSNTNTQALIEKPKQQQCCLNGMLEFVHRGIRVVYFSVDVKVNTHEHI